jgi:hypothetical protein
MPVLRAWCPGKIETWRRAYRAQRAIAAAEHLGPLVLFTVVTALVFRTWLPHLDAALIGPPEDNMQDLWNAWYAAVGRRRGHVFFTDLLRYPEGASLYLHAFAYPKVAAIAALGALLGTDTGALVLLHNLSLLMSFPIAGAGAFLLVRHLTGSRLGALLGGFVFAFNPSHVEHAMHHAGVASIELIPLFALGYLLAVERKSPAFLALAVVCYALTALSSWYYLVYLGGFILFHALYVAVLERRLPSGWRLVAAIACPAAVAAILSPILIPMVRTAVDTGWLSGEGAGAGAYAADLVAYIAVPRFHALAPLADGIYRRLGGNEWEATVYLGLANVALLGWVCLTGRARQAPMLRYALAGVAVFAVVACGSWLQVLGQQTIPLPGALLSGLPPLSMMQAPSRAVVLVYLFLAIAIAEAVRLAAQQRGPFVRTALLAAVAAIALDYLPARALPMTPVACPAALAIIRDDAEAGFGVLDLPPHGYVERNFYMLQQTCHGRPIVLGNTSRRVVTSLGDRLDTWTVEAQRAQLLAAKVKYVVMRSAPGAGASATEARPDPSLRFAWAPEDASPAHYAAVYRVVHESAELTIFRVY